MTKGQTKNTLKAGDKIIFIGYPEGFDEEPIFEAGDELTVMEAVTRDGELLGYSAKRADGKADQVFIGEYEAVEAEQASTDEQEEEAEPIAKVASKPKAKAKKETAAKEGAPKTTTKQKTVKKPAKKVASKTQEATTSEVVKVGEPSNTSLVITEESMSVERIIAEGDVHEATIYLNNRARASSFMLGGLLLYIRDNDLHVQKGYAKDQKGFKQYCIDHVGVSYETASKNINIYKRVLTIGGTEDDVRGWSWTKLDRVINYVDSISELNEWRDYAETHTREQLEAKMDEEGLVKRERVVTKAAETAVRHTFRFAYNEEDAAYLARALESMKEQSGREIDNDPDALLSIVESWFTLISGDESITEEALADVVSNILGRKVEFVDVEPELDLVGSEREQEVA